MVLELEKRLAAVRLVVVHALLGGKKDFAVLERLHVELVALLARGGAVATEGEHVHVKARDEVDELRELVGVHAGHRVHDRHPDARSLEALDGAQGLGEGTRLAEVVVRGLEAVERKLVLTAAERLHARTDLVVEVEGIAHHAPHEAALVEELH